MTGDTAPARHPAMRTYGRKGGRPLSPRQTGLLASGLGAVALPEGEAPFDPRTLFPGARETWLEIGFGGAEHLTTQAARHPDAGLIGAEPFIEGVAKALVAITEQRLTNVRLWPGDARPLIERIAPGTLARVFILFPDPWPKRRQQKRRLIQPGFLDSLHRALAPGAGVRFATDVASYADEALLAFLQHGGFAWTPRAADDWRCPPADHVTTRYEAKRLGDCAPVWLDFRAA